ncbi:hypothetical protein MTR67_039749, partial [Solanum verrucosum]
WSWRANQKVRDRSWDTAKLPLTWSPIILAGLLLQSSTKVLLALGNCETQQVGTLTRQC